jgi:hypothetical protein
MFVQKRGSLGVVRQARNGAGKIKYFVWSPQVTFKTCCCFGRANVFKLMLTCTLELCEIQMLDHFDGESGGTVCPSRRLEW